MDTTNWLQSAKDPSPDPGTHHRLRGLGWSAPWSTADDVTLAELHAQFGERWAAIAQRMPGRTAVQIKSRWHGKQRGKTARHPTFLDAYLRHLQDASCPNHYHNDDTPSAAAERRVAALSKARAMLAAGELADVRPRASRPLLNRGRPAARSEGTGGGGSGNRKRSLSPRGGGDEDTNEEEEDELIGPYSSSRLAPLKRSGGAYAAAAAAGGGGKRAACALPPLGPQQQPSARWHVAASGAGNAIGGVGDEEELEDMLLEADRLRPQHTLCWRSCRAAGVSWQANTSGGHSDSDGTASDALVDDGDGNSAFGGGNGGRPSPTAAAAGGTSRGAATCYTSVDNDDVVGGGRLGRLGGGGGGEPIEVDDDALDRVLSVEEAELSALSFIDGLIGLRGALPPAALQRPVALPPPPPPPPPPLPLPHARALAPLVLQAPFAPAPPAAVMRPMPPPPPPGEQLWLAMEARCRHCDGNGRKSSRYHRAAAATAIAADDDDGPQVAVRGRPEAAWWPGDGTDPERPRPGAFSSDVTAATIASPSSPNAFVTLAAGDRSPLGNGSGGSGGSGRVGSVGFGRDHFVGPRTDLRASKELLVRSSHRPTHPADRSAGGCEARRWVQPPPPPPQKQQLQQPDWDWGWNEACGEGGHHWSSAGYDGSSAGQRMDAGGGGSLSGRGGLGAWGGGAGDNGDRGGGRPVQGRPHAVAAVLVDKPGYRGRPMAALAAPGRDSAAAVSTRSGVAGSAGQRDAGRPPGGDYADGACWGVAAVAASQGDATGRRRHQLQPAADVAAPPGVYPPQPYRRDTGQRESCREPLQGAGASARRGGVTRASAHPWHPHTAGGGALQPYVYDSSASPFRLELEAQAWGAALPAHALDPAELPTVLEPLPPPAWSPTLCGSGVNPWDYGGGDLEEADEKPCWALDALPLELPPPPPPAWVAEPATDEERGVLPAQTPSPSPNPLSAKVRGKAPAASDATLSAASQTKQPTANSPRRSPAPPVPATVPGSGLGDTSVAGKPPGSATSAGGGAGLGPAAPPAVSLKPRASTAVLPGQLPFEYGSSPLHDAVQAGDLPSITKLLQSGAGLEAMNASAETPLVLAMNLGQLEAVRALAAAGASRLYRLHWAAAAGHAKSVAELLRQGAPPDLADEYGVVPLHKAAAAGHGEAVGELLAAGADVHAAVQGDRSTPLLLACARGHAGVAARLLAAGARRGDRDELRRGPLGLAAWSGSAETMQVLLEAGADPEEVDGQGRTPLHLAAAGGHTAAAAALLAAGCRRDVRDGGGETALVAAMRAGQAGAQAALQAAGANPHLRLHWACQAGDMEVVRKLLLTQVPVDLQDDDGFTALNVACRHGRTEAAALLLEARASPHLAAASGHTPLMSAAEAGHGALVRSLLEAGADLRMMTMQGRTALHLAAANSHLEAVQELLVAVRQLPTDGPLPPTWQEQREAMQAAALRARLGQAGPGGRSSSGSGLLLGAAVSPSLTRAYVAQVTRALATETCLDTASSKLLPTAVIGAIGTSTAQQINGRDVPSRISVNNSTSNHHAASNSSLATAPGLASGPSRGPSLLGAAPSLLQSPGAGPGSAFAGASYDTHTISATQLAVGTGEDAGGQAAERTSGAGAEAPSLPRLPLSCPGIVDAQDFAGWTAALRAASSGHLPLLQALMGCGANINAFNESHDTALHVAARNGHVEVVRALIAAGAPLETPNKDGNTALHLAAAAGRLAMVDLLCTVAAALDARNGNAETPLAMAVMSGHVEVIRDLIGRGADIGARDSAGRPLLLMATRSNQMGSMQLLVEAGCDVNAHSLTAATALHGAAGAMDEEAVALLLRAGAEPRAANTNGEAPLHYAATKGRAGVVALLLDAGAPADTRDNNKVPPSHLAVMYGHIEVLRLLLERGADPNSADCDGDTPLTLAGREDRAEIASLLLSRGASPLARTADGLAPVHRAAEAGRLGALRLLLEAGAGAGADRSLLTGSGRGLLHVAAAFGQADVARHLLAEAGMDPHQASAGGRRGVTVSALRNYDHREVLVVGTRLTTLSDALAQWDPNTAGPRVTNANTPLPPDRQLVYVEVTVAEVPHGSPFTLSIGLGRDIGRTDFLPGFYQETYGYLSSTGARYQGSRSNTKQYGPKYGKGDVIGLVYNRAFRTLSYTRNGQHLGVAARNVPTDGQSLFIGFGHKGITVDVNFGASPFAFNPDDLGVDEEAMHNPGHKEPWRAKERVYPLHLAACSSSLPTLEPLMGAGALVDQTDADSWTALHFAALLGWHEAIRLLLAKGASPNAATQYGSTPLLFSVKRSHTEAAKVLLDKGADFRVVDKDGRTLLMWAASTGNTEVMQLLIDKGVGIKEKDALGRTALQYACNETVVSYLEKALNQILVYRDCFEINRQAEIKHGAEGSVVTATWRHGAHAGSGNCVAIKFYKHREVRDHCAGVLRQLSPKFAATLAPIAESDTIFDDPARYPDCPYALVMDAGDKDLQEILDEWGAKPMPENQTRYIFECMVAAVQHLHTLGHVHHDLKPHNFVRFFDGRYCLVDLDSARQAYKEDMGFTTVDVCPPEVAASLLRGERLPSHPAMDVWSLGCCLYQMVMQAQLLCDLRPEWKGGGFRRDTADTLKGLSRLTQADVDRALDRVVAARRGGRLGEHAHSLLHHMLQVDPKLRYSIEDVSLHAFLKGGSTRTMDEEALRGIRTTLVDINSKVDSVLQHVVRIEERTLALADLPQQLQAGLADISSRLHGIQALVMQVAAASSCPSSFVVTPELSPRQLALQMGLQGPGHALMSAWLYDLKQVFTCQLSMGDVLQRLINRRFRLRLVCQSCMRPCGEGYLIERPETFTAKLLPALLVSFHLLRAYNVAASLGRFVFPMLPVVPPDLMDSARGVLAALREPSGRPEDFSCIREEVDAVVGYTSGGGAAPHPPSHVAFSGASILAPKTQVGSSLRQLHAFLDEVDRSRTWAGLTLVEVPGRPPIWVCLDCITAGAPQGEERGQGPAASGAAGAAAAGGRGGTGRPPHGAKGRKGGRKEGHLPPKPRANGGGSGGSDGVRRGGGGGGRALEEAEEEGGSEGGSSESEGGGGCLNLRAGGGRRGGGSGRSSSGSKVYPLGFGRGPGFAPGRTGSAHQGNAGSRPRQPCRFFSSPGGCRLGAACTFFHDASGPGSGAASGSSRPQQQGARSGPGPEADAFRTFRSLALAPALDRADKFCLFLGSAIAALSGAGGQDKAETVLQMLCGVWRPRPPPSSGTIPAGGSPAASVAAAGLYGAAAMVASSKAAGGPGEPEGGGGCYAERHLRRCMEDFNERSRRGSLTPEVLASRVVPMLRLLSHEAIRESLRSHWVNPLYDTVLLCMDFDALAGVYERMAAGSLAVPLQTEQVVTQGGGFRWAPCSWLDLLAAPLLLLDELLCRFTQPSARQRLEQPATALAAALGALMAAHLGSREGGQGGGGGSAGVGSAGRRLWAVLRSVQEQLRQGQAAERIRDDLQAAQRRQEAAARGAVGRGDRAAEERLRDPTHLPGSLRPGGPRHDNDVDDFRAIAVVPTAQELLCRAPPYLPSNRPGSVPHLAAEPHRARLETLFRLPRHDVVAPLAAALHSFRQRGGLAWLQRLQEAQQGRQTHGRRKHDERRSQQGPTNGKLDLEGGQQMFVFRGVRVEGLNVSRNEGGMVVQPKQAERAAQQRTAPSEVAPTLVVGVVSRRDPRELAGLNTPGGRPMVGIRLLEKSQPCDASLVHAADLHALLGAWMDAEAGAGRELVLVQEHNSFFSYEPVLQALQGIQEIPLAHHLVPGCEPPLPADSPTTSPGPASAASASASAASTCAPPAPPLLPAFWADWPWVDLRHAADRARILALPEPERVRVLRALGAVDLSAAAAGRFPLDELLAASILDRAQAEALRATLCQEVAVVQGPPGTGKTFLGVVFTRVLLRNTVNADPGEDGGGAGRVVFPGSRGRGRGRRGRGGEDDEARLPAWIHRDVGAEAAVPSLDLAREAEEAAEAAACAAGRPAPARAPGPAARPDVGPLLVVCFTNHALDAFLEGLLDAQVTDRIVRVGGSSRSERLEPYNLRNLQFRAGGNQVRHLKDRVRALEETATHLSCQLSGAAAAQRRPLTWEELEPALRQHYPALHASFLRGVRGSESRDGEAGNPKRPRKEHPPDDLLADWLKGHPAADWRRGRVPLAAERAAAEARRAAAAASSLIADDPDDGPGSLPTGARPEPSQPDDVMSLSSQGGDGMSAGGDGKEQARQDGSSAASGAADGDAAMEEAVLDAAEANASVAGAEAGAGGAGGGGSGRGRDRRAIDDTAGGAAGGRSDDAPGAAWAASAARAALACLQAATGAAVTAAAARGTQLGSLKRPRESIGGDTSAPPPAKVGRTYVCWMGDARGPTAPPPPPPPPPPPVPDEVVAMAARRRPLEELLECDDVWAMSSAERATLHEGTLRRLPCLELFGRVQELQAEYEQVNEELQAEYDQASLAALRCARVVGMTTSGVARHQSLVAALKPRVVLMEEAAEVFEAHVLACLSRGVEALVLVGDHLQLRPKPNQWELQAESGRGLDLDVSLFERLVRAGADRGGPSGTSGVGGGGSVPVALLEEQRRMRPEISQLIRGPLYPHLRDHPRVRSHPPVRGLARSLLFVNHDHPEGGGDEGSDDRSKVNPWEAEYAVGLALHLIMQGYAPSDIVILVPYVGQMFAVRRALERVNLRVVVGDRDVAAMEDLEEAGGLNGANGVPPTAAAQGGGAGPTSVGLVSGASGGGRREGSSHDPRGERGPRGEGEGGKPDGGGGGNPSERGRRGQGTGAGTGGGGGAGRDDEGPALPPGARIVDVREGVRVATVDNFQGEEATVVLLSTVRNNPDGRIGFLAMANRVNVMLSRAKHGMVVLGHEPTLRAGGERRGGRRGGGGAGAGGGGGVGGTSMWCQVLDQLHREGCVAPCVRIKCANHGTELDIPGPSDFRRLAGDGGCGLPCGQALPCGHSCPRRCHADDRAHALTRCTRPCARLHAVCGHPCGRLCSEACGRCEAVQREPVRLDCGHEAAGVVCWQRFEPGAIRCQVPVEVRRPACGHTSTVPCCDAAAERSGDRPCAAMVSVALPACGHTVDVACAVAPALLADPTACPAPCDALLACEHACSGKCGTCVRRVMHGGFREVVQDWAAAQPSSLREGLDRVLAPPGGGSTDMEEGSDGGAAEGRSGPGGSAKGEVEAARGVAQVLRFLSEGQPGAAHRQSFISHLRAQLDRQRPAPAPAAASGGDGGGGGDGTEGADPLFDTGFAAAFKNPFAASHRACTQRCSRVGPCGHTCDAPCHAGKPCRPCARPCWVACAHHRRCLKPCGEPCVPCAEPCVWACEHRGRCAAPCGAPCERLPCDARCSRQLACKHRCPGLCGEDCPPARFCTHPDCLGLPERQNVRDQVVDLIMQQPLGAVAPGELEADPLVVLGCGHAFLTSSLDGIMGLASTPKRRVYEAAVVALKRLQSDLLCEERRTIRARDREGGSAASGGGGGGGGQAGAVAALAQRVAVAEADLRSLRPSGLQLCRAQVGLLRAAELHVVAAAEGVAAAGRLAWEGGRLREGGDQGGGSPTNLYTRYQCARQELFKQTVGRLFASALEIHHDFVMRGGPTWVVEARAGRHWASSLRLSVARMRAGLAQLRLLRAAESLPGPGAAWARVLGVGRERLRELRDAAVAQVRTSGEDAMSLYRGESGFQASGYDSESVRLVRELLERLEQLVAQNDTATLQAVLAAVATGETGGGANPMQWLSGHLYECPNGHPYTIGNCGQAMQSSRCPECGAPMGGNNHTLQGRNRQAAGLVEQLRQAQQQAR
ncbi:hypothetical protein HYH03_006767 [Edaphochlamys debaryana]|uniref:Uncharacterized protein n=1 Tax=Edaphochlamys debaryana TaxID=47281 RepID=A0A836C148_9CHLO|nr:hypothetical protein HYH03_006767 [Edaphochlamys debaryana]|eukprot:KAG2495159.1 hypothetical protein HYH03_006767 [Edaphochlamys debaryana]